MSESRFLDYYLQAYQQCHRHIRLIAKKRDRTIAFYVVIVGIMFGSLNALTGELKDLKDILIFVVAMVGLVLAIALMNYRKWHINFQNSFIVLQNLHINDLPPTEQNIAGTWKKLITDKTSEHTIWNITNPFKSIEVTVFDAFLIFSFLPWHLVIRKFPYAFEIPINSDIIVFILNLITYIVLLNFIGVYVLKRADKEGYKKLWPFKLDLYKNPNVEKESE